MIDQALIEDYLQRIWSEKGLRDNTLVSYRRDLSQFSQWLHRHQLSLMQADAGQVQGFLAERLQSRHSARSTARTLSCVRGFYQYWVREGRLSVNPLQHIDNPKIARALPKSLSERDVEALLEAPDLENPLGLRDRAMLELLYACGLRVTELVTLTVNQINSRQGVVRIEGKGGKERLVPMGEQALYWLEQYLRQGRSALLGVKPSDWLFPSSRARQMTRQTFWHRIKHWAAAAGINAHLSPHTVRHAFATHLLNHGADIRSVQLLLGHSDLSTTQIYTHVAQFRMQALVAKHHPRG